MVKFLGNPLEIPGAVTGVQAVRKQYVDDLAARVSTLESGGTGGTVWNARTVTANTTAVKNDFVLCNCASNAITVTLPATHVKGDQVAVKKIDNSTFAATIVPGNAATIDGDSSAVLATGQAGAVFVSNGTNWYVQSIVYYDSSVPQNLTYRNTWSSSTPYATNDVVSYNGSSYVAITASTNSVPTTPANWSVLAAKGADGAPGAAGTAGAAGTNGTNGTNGVGFTFRGTWNPSVAYVVNDVVAYNGSTYVSIYPGTGFDPLTQTGNWKPIATGFNYRGAYSDATTYYRQDVVSFSGQSFVANNDIADLGVTGIAPITGSSGFPWSLLSRGVNYRGVFDSGQTYMLDDVVMFRGSAYIYMITTNGVNENGTPGDDVNWHKFVYGFNFLGAYSTSPPYYIGDVVTRNGATWLCILDITVGGQVAPNTGSAYWSLLAAKGVDGTNGTNATVSVGTTTTGAAGSNASVTNSGTNSAAVLNFTVPAGATGPAGPGVPAGGLTSQYLRKIDGTDYNTAWTTIYQLPSGGTTGQVLAKSSAVSYAVTWAESGGLKPQTITSNTYTAQSGDCVLVNATSGAATVTLPASASNGQIVVVRKIDSGPNAVTVVPTTGSFFLEFVPTAQTSVKLTAPSQYIEFIWDSTAVTWRQLRGSSNYELLAAPIVPSGNWLDRRTFYGAVGSTASPSFTPGVNQLYYVSVFSHYAMSIQALGYVVGGTPPTSGAAVRIGLYSNVPATGVPGTLLWDSGSLSLGSSATVALTKTYTNIIPKGWSWFGLAYNATAPGTCGSLPTSFSPPVPNTGLVSTALTYAQATGSMAPMFYYENISGGTFPATATPIAGYAALAGNLWSPNVWWRLT